MGRPTRTFLVERPSNNQSVTGDWEYVMECEWYDRTPHNEPIPCKRVASVVLRCLDTTAEGPDREARFEWTVCSMHAHELSDQYSSGDVVVESEEPV